MVGGLFFNVITLYIYMDSPFLYRKGRSLLQVISSYIHNLILNQEFD